MTEVFRDLHPELQPYATWLYRVAEYYGLGPKVTSTYRSYATQARLYNRYLSGESPYPAAPPGRSLHNRGLAFDMVVKEQEWLGNVWENIGGRWGGRFRDPVHFDVGL